MRSLLPMEIIATTLINRAIKTIDVIDKNRKEIRFGHIALQVHKAPIWRFYKDIKIKP